MIAFILIFLTLLALLAFLMAAWLLLETLAAQGGTGESEKAEEAQTFAIIVPAHNEAAIIAETLANLRAQMRAGDRLVVVADNCTDETAEIARKSGAEVLERQDKERRGKGYALQYALDALRAAPPSLIVFTDADCCFAPGALQRLTALAERSARPVQALYLMKAPPGTGARLQVAEFAWTFMNNVRMRGLQKLAGGVRFTGAGFAAPWFVLADVDLASGEIVEDLALTMALARRNAAPVFAPTALVTSEFPTDDAALSRQAARWSIGSMQYAVKAAAGAFVSGVAKGNWRQAAIALDLMIPPLTIFVLSLTVLSLVSLIFWITTGVSGPFILSGAALVFAALAVLLGWNRYGREALPPSALAGVFAFFVSKFSVFSREGRDSAKSWTPTRGGSDGAGE